MTRVVRIGLTVAFLTSAFGDVATKWRIALALEARLNSALAQEKKPITLRLGTKFTERPGAIIFISRKEGRKRMIAMARAGELELCMLYLPRLDAWITQTTLYARAKSDIDDRYARAAYASEPKELGIELWHIQSNVPDEDLPAVEPEEERRRSLQWTMPSPGDFVQLYVFALNAPPARLLGVIAHIYGTTTYWSDRPNWTELPFVVNAFYDEAEGMSNSAGESTLEEMEAVAAKFDGVMKLRFELEPAERN